MVAHGDTGAAEGAVLGAGGFCEIACAADVAWLEENVVIRIVAETMVVIRRIDMVAAVSGGEVGKKVWAGDEERNREHETVWKTRNGACNEGGYAARRKREEEDLVWGEKQLERFCTCRGDFVPGQLDSSGRTSTAPVFYCFW